MRPAVERTTAECAETAEAAATSCSILEAIVGRRFLTLMLPMAVVLAACTASPPVVAQHALRVGVIQAADQLPYWVMQEQGFARANGLELKPTTFSAGRDVISSIAAGKIDAGFPGTAPLLSAGADGTVPGSVVGVAAGAFADSNHKAIALLVGSKIRSWADLSGRDIAVNQPGSSVDVALRVRLKAEHVEGVRFVSIPFPNHGLAVAGGNVAGAALIEPYVTQSLLRKDGRVLDWLAGGGAPFPNFQLGASVFATHFVREHPDVVSAFIRAQLQAQRWIMNNDKDARAVLTKALGLTPEVGENLNLSRFSEDGRNDPVLLGQLQDALAGFDPGRRVVPVRTLYDETLLSQIKE